MRPCVKQRVDRSTMYSQASIGNSVADTGLGLFPDRLTLGQIKDCSLESVEYANRDCGTIDTDRSKPNTIAFCRLGYRANAYALQ